MVPDYEAGVGLFGDPGGGKRRSGKLQVPTRQSECLIIRAGPHPWTRTKDCCRRLLPVGLGPSQPTWSAVRLSARAPPLTNFVAVRFAVSRTVPRRTMGPFSKPAERPLALRRDGLLSLPDLEQGSTVKQARERVLSLIVTVPSLTKSGPNAKPPLRQQPCGSRLTGPHRARSFAARPEKLPDCLSGHLWMRTRFAPRRCIVDEPGADENRLYRGRLGQRTHWNQHRWASSVRGEWL